MKRCPSSAQMPIACMLFSFLAAAACSSSPPELLGITYRVSLVPGSRSGESVENLSVFAAVQDEDGIVDLESLYIINDASELFWKFSRDTWIEREEEKDTWIGSNGITTNDDSPIPRGQYRMVLIDKSGERSEKSFIVSAPSTNGMKLPKLAYDDGSVDLSSPYPQNKILFLDVSGDTTAVATIENGSTKVEKLFGSPSWKDSVAYICVQAYDPSLNLGFVSVKIPLR